MYHEVAEFLRLKKESVDNNTDNYMAMTSVLCEKEVEEAYINASIIAGELEASS